MTSRRTLSPAAQAVLDAVIDQWLRIRRKLLAIAAELEAT